jgi:NADP-dependent 3-hydroxy acid dehydrogenase YdfG
MDKTHRRFGWLITGASQGFGRALAAEVLSRGEAVVGAVRDEESVRELRGRYPGQLSVAVADLRDPGAVERIIGVARERFGTPDVLVNNVGRAIVGAAEEVTPASLRELLELNFFAAAELTRAVLPGMRERGSGTIIQMSSQGGRMSFPGAGAAAGFAEQVLDPLGQPDPGGLPNLTVAGAGAAPATPADQGGFTTTRCSTCCRTAPSSSPCSRCCWLSR